MRAATLQGWGGPRLLEAHEAERLPITAQVSHDAMNHSIAVARQRGAVPPDIEMPEPVGDAIRAHDGPAPAYSMYGFTSSTVPGCRTPPVQPLAAARQRGVPLALADRIRGAA
ncbi:hypothetical protein ACFQU2_11900 [Siccirubricoccus deserti]